MSTDSNSTLRPTILAFLKAPILGTVKTRLAQDIGDEKALSAYRWLVDRQLADRPLDWNLEIHFAPSDSLHLMEDWLGSEHDFHPQCAGDLGSRLSLGVAGAFARAATTVHCIGGDCPTLGTEDFTLAEKQLAGGIDLVFGPATDGGYTLVSLRRPVPAIFKGVPWSSEQTLAVSIQKAEERSLSYRLLSQKSDVDTLADWEKVEDRPTQ